MTFDIISYIIWPWIKIWCNSTAQCCSIALSWNCSFWNLDFEVCKRHLFLRLFSINDENTKMPHNGSVNDVIQISTSKFANSKFERFHRLVEQCAQKFVAYVLHLDIKRHLFWIRNQCSTKYNEQTLDINFDICHVCMLLPGCSRAMPVISQISTILYLSLKVQTAHELLYKIYLLHTQVDW